MHLALPPRFQALFCRSRLRPANPGPMDHKLQIPRVHRPVLLIEREQHTPPVHQNASEFATWK